MSNDGTYILITTTVEDDLDAKKMADSLVRAHLAACVHITKVKSIYRWKDNIEEAAEYQLRAKTTKRLEKKVIEHIREQHTYEVPQITVIPIIGGHQPYLDWIETETAEG